MIHRFGKVIDGAAFESLNHVINRSGSGYDDDRNGLFTERDGRPRNSGRLPEQQVVSLHASRRFAVSGLPGRPRVRMFLTTGVQVENLLNTRNVTALGAVAGSSIFGRPLAALGGRSVRSWFNLG